MDLRSSILHVQATGHGFKCPFTRFWPTICLKGTIPKGSGFNHIYKGFDLKSYGCPQEWICLLLTWNYCHINDQSKQQIIVMMLTSNTWQSPSWHSKKGVFTLLDPQTITTQAHIAQLILAAERLPTLHIHWWFHWWNWNRCLWMHVTLRHRPITTSRFNVISTIFSSPALKLISTEDKHSKVQNWNQYLKVKKFHFTSNSSFHFMTADFKCLSLNCDTILKFNHDWNAKSLNKI